MPLLVYRHRCLGLAPLLLSSIKTSKLEYRPSFFLLPFFLALPTFVQGSSLCDPLQGSSSHVTIAKILQFIEQDEEREKAASGPYNAGGTHAMAPSNHSRLVCRSFCLFARPLPSLSHTDRPSRRYYNWTSCELYIA
ncbi:uncharacterized protein TrAtP1_009469 [Trichoderma atroviride]|uniref:uncharacterized protein n=1 Tax=Hypocrea atroviridis TaxID=63577 RepID=UPI0033335544|nr:hypothetical protein TrAtP1_009469 [Trichoderma atroviride]